MKDAINSFFLKSTIWMHAALVLFLAFAFMKFNLNVGFSQFANLVFGLLIFSIPTFLIIIYRDNYDLPRSTYLILWIVVFIGLPVLLFTLQLGIHKLPFLDKQFKNDLTGEYLFLTLSCLFLVLEVIIFLTEISPNKSKLNISRKKAFWLALLVSAIFGFFLMTLSTLTSELTIGMSDIETTGLFVVLLFQLVIIYFSYYIYYYIHHYLLFNILLKQKGFVAYMLGIVLVLLIVAPLHNYLISFFPAVTELKLHPIALQTNIYDDFNFALPLMVLLVSFPVIVIIEWYKQSNAIILLQKEKSSAELGLLKQQINPHFFFNTLNNLYAMSLKKSAHTPETILKLSDLMRYVIYRGKEPLVSLKEELSYIQDYIDLQLIRNHKKVDLQFEKNIENDRMKVPPLIFIILIENAFKHGVETIESDAFLHISLAQKESKITIDCKNNFNKNLSPTSKGIGLLNLEKRLDILFPNRYEFITKVDNNQYHSKLQLNL